jgi:hypothetical protein
MGTRQLLESRGNIRVILLMRTSFMLSCKKLSPSLVVKVSDMVIISQHLTGICVVRKDLVEGFNLYLRHA